MSNPIESAHRLPYVKPELRIIQAPDAAGQPTKANIFGTETTTFNTAGPLNAS